MKISNLFKTAYLCMLISFLSINTASSQNTQYSYICPEPGSKNINTEQNIIIGYSKSLDPMTISPENIDVRGSVSGLIQVEVLVDDDHKRIIYKPLEQFKPGEIIEVKIKDGICSVDGENLLSIVFHFTVIDYDKGDIYKRWEELSADNDDELISLGANLPIRPPTDNNLPPDYPAPTVYSYGEHDHDYVFINMNCRNSSLPWGKYITILDSYGTPIYFHKSENNRINFSILPNGTLCYSVNRITNGPEEKYYIMDSAYMIIDSVNTGNGYILDAHDMLLLDNGHYLVMSYDPQPVNMSQIIAGGNPNAIVTGLVIQEVDNNENVFFQWRSWDHFEITDATADIDLTAAGIDYVHGNAFEIDIDGNILLSSRHLDEITKINFTTGDVIWRFGKNSENNEFQITDDPYGFTHQHDIRLLPNGHYTIYDNGNLRAPQFSQVLEYILDQSNYTAQLAWDFHHSPYVYAGSAGSFRTQSNGQRIIGWGGTFPLAVTELKTDNTILREFFLPDFVNTYRAIKSPWETNVFETQEQLSMGNFAGYSGSKENLLYIYNTSSEIIRISSVHNHLPEYEVLSEFPISIFPNSYTVITVLFHANVEGEYVDRFTLNSDNEDTTQRIARQLEVYGIYDEDVPSVFFIPSHGSVNISPQTEIIIDFDEPVIKTFGGEILNEEIPSLIDLRENNKDGQEISFSGIINEEKTRIIITPDQALDENQQYYILLKRGQISDFEGNVINLDEESYFTTGLIINIDNKRLQGVYIFPNPFNERINIRNISQSDYSIQVYDVRGQLISSSEYSGCRFEINLSSVTNGIYFIRILNKKSGESMVYKTIKNTTLN